MGQNWYNGIPESLTIAARGTGSFTPQAISNTPFVSVQIIKDTPNASIDTLLLHTCNVDAPTGQTNNKWPSGSLNEYLWCNETDFQQATSGTLLAAPFVTGSGTGSITYHVGNINSRFARVTIRSNSGGVFRISGFGKE